MKCEVVEIGVTRCVLSSVCVALSQSFLFICNLVFNVPLFFVSFCWSNNNTFCSVFLFLKRLLFSISFEFNATQQVIKNQTCSLNFWGFFFFPRCSGKLVN